MTQTTTTIDTRLQRNFARMRRAFGAGAVEQAITIHNEADIILASGRLDFTPLPPAPTPERCSCGVRYCREWHTAQGVGRAYEVRGHGGVLPQFAAPPPPTKRGRCERCRSTGPVQHVSGNVWRCYKCRERDCISEAHARGEAVHYVYEDGLTACTEEDGGDDEIWSERNDDITCEDCRREIGIDGPIEES